MQENGLDLRAIHPRNGEKYSPNLHAWLTLRTKKHRAETSRVFSDPVRDKPRPSGRGRIARTAQPSFGI